MMGGKFLKMTMSSVPLRAKTVLVRTDYNVPLTDDGKVRDDYRIVKSLPTIRKLLSEGCKVVIISHLGRPNGVANPSCSLEPVAVRLAELLGEPVRFVDRCVCLFKTDLGWCTEHMLALTQLLVFCRVLLVFW